MTVVWKKGERGGREHGGLAEDDDLDTIGGNVRIVI
jgi:hypothetical protein